MYLFNRIFI